jgi:Ca2+-binding RTX toxin-like protein
MLWLIRDGLGTFAYRWQASADGSTGWTDIVGANMDVFTPTQAEVGQHLRLVVSYTDNLGGAELVFSAASIAVVNVNDTPTGTVSIMGPAIQGQTMTATNTLADADGMGIVGYQWQVSVIGDTDWSDIADAIGVSYTPEQGLVGKHVRVLGNYTDGAGTAESVASTATTAVVNINDAPTLTTITPLTGASEDTGFTLTYAALAAAANEADVDLGDTLSFRVEALSTGSLTKAGLAVVPGSTLLASGESLVWTPAPNASGSALNAFTVVAWDGTAASATPVQLSVDVGSLNDAPTLGGVPVTAQAITTGQAAALADFTVADVDSTDLSLTLTATNGVINGLTDAYPATTGIQLSGTAEQINAAIAGATFTATAAGAASINLSLSDGTALAVTGSYNLTAANPVSQALNGTPGADTLTGTANNDTINGLAGNDTLSGGLGNDTLDGGADLDTASYASATGAVTAFLWSNQVTGADGTDSLISIENLIGSGFADRLDGTNSANDLSGGAGADTLNAYAGADTLSGGAGNDTLDGGADLDTVSYASATGAVTVFLWGSQATGADGTDAVYNTENVIGSGFADRLDGTNSANDLSGGAGNDTLYGYAGNDTIAGGAGNDTLDGGADLDTVSYASATGAVTVFLWGSQATGADGTDAVYNTENVIGSGFADRLDGTNSANALTGGAGNDSLYGYAGADTLTGGAGDDTLTGGADNDTFVYAASGAGIDTLTDLSQGDTLLISAALTSLSTGNGASVTGNAVQVSTSAGTTTLWIDTNNSAGAELQINLTGSYSASTLSLINNGNGTSSLSRTSALNLIGDASANTLTAAATDDTLSGLAGNDTLIAGAGNDLIDGGADLDTASYASATGAVTVFLWGGQATGADGNDALANIENLIGSGFADRLDGTNSANDLSGGAGADTLNAYAGADTLSGGAGNDTLDGGADLDTVSYASATGAVTVFLWGSQATGADGTDAVYNTENVQGSGFADRLDGTNSANDLSGGAGATTPSTATQCNDTMSWRSRQRHPRRRGRPGHRQLRKCHRRRHRLPLGQPGHRRRRHRRRVQHRERHRIGLCRPPGRHQQRQRPQWWRRCRQPVRLRRSRHNHRGGGQRLAGRGGRCGQVCLYRRQRLGPVAELLQCTG